MSEHDVARDQRTNGHKTPANFGATSAIDLMYVRHGAVVNTISPSTVAADNLERSFSIDRVRRFKPAPQVYHMVAEELDVPTSAICMVAAHVWDTIGAQSVGCAAALIARPGNAPLPVPGLPQPQAVAADLPGVATQLIKLWR